MFSNTYGGCRNEEALTVLEVGGYVKTADEDVERTGLDLRKMLHGGAINTAHDEVDAHLTAADTFELFAQRQTGIVVDAALRVGGGRSGGGDRQDEGISCGFDLLIVGSGGLVRSGLVRRCSGGRATNQQHRKDQQHDQKMFFHGVSPFLFSQMGNRLCICTYGKTVPPLQSDDAFMFDRTMLISKSFVKIHQIACIHYQQFAWV